MNQWKFDCYLKHTIMHMFWIQCSRDDNLIRCLLIQCLKHLFGPFFAINSGGNTKETVHKHDINIQVKFLNSNNYERFIYSYQKFWSWLLQNTFIFIMCDFCFFGQVLIQFLCKKKLLIRTSCSLHHNKLFSHYFCYSDKRFFSLSTR